MTAAEVREVLESFPFRFESTLHGFDLLSHGSNCRVVHGGGISGTNAEWWIEHRSGNNKTRRVSTRRALRRLLTEWAAGEPPMDVPPGYTLYARLNHNRFGSSYVWCLRRESTP